LIPRWWTKLKGFNAFWFQKPEPGFTSKISQSNNRGNFSAVDVLTIITEPFSAFIGD
jgi:hypothetical protein